MLINNKPLKMYKQLVDKPAGYYYLFTTEKLDFAQKYCFKLLSSKSFRKDRKKIPYGTSLIWMYTKKSAPYVYFKIQKIED